MASTTKTAELGGRRAYAGAPPKDGLARAIPAVLRIALGLLWMQNSFWKVPPDFGRRQGKLLYGFVLDAVRYPVFAPYTAFVKHVVLPHFTLFGWGVLLTESTLAALLVLGLGTRLVGLGELSTRSPLPLRH